MINRWIITKVLELNGKEQIRKLTSLESSDHFDVLFKMHLRLWAGRSLLMGLQGINPLFTTC